MADRELLEKAAKAAGLVGGLEYWNPLDNDGAAFRLAVVLNLRVSVHIDHVSVEDLIRPREWIEPISGDSEALAATRRAIVRAAAALGESA